VLSHPALNAALNATAAVLLVSGYTFIRRRNVTAHRVCMVAAFLASTAFLISYLIYHARVGSVPFHGQGWIRPVYFFILFTHIVLAAAILPLALVTLSRALREQFDRHKRIARWTLPVWLYVSVTGVVIYFLLYHLYAAG
jgi:putative membrane protein